MTRSKQILLWCTLAATFTSCSSERFYDLMLRASAVRLDKDLAGLDRANRLVIEAHGGSQVRSTVDHETIRMAVHFFQRYRDGWMILSGAAGDYNFYLYRDVEPIARLGITETTSGYPGQDTLNFGDRFRRVPASEVADFARRLELRWPPSR